MQRRARREAGEETMPGSQIVDAVEPSSAYAANLDVAAGDPVVALLSSLFFLGKT